MIWWVLATIATLFVVFAFLRDLIHKKLSIKVCSICAAVSLTWIALFALKITGRQISDLLLGILMGESVTGIMYLFESKAKSAGKNSLLWLKILIILFGTALAYFVLSEGFSTNFLIVLGISILLVIVVFNKMRSKKKPKHDQKNRSKFSDEIKKLEEKLEHCCD